MAKHKTPSQVTVAPLFEKSALEKSLDRYKVPASAVLVAIVILILFSHYSREAARKKLDRSWETLIAQTTPDPMTGLPSASVATLASLAADLRDAESGPWTRLLEVRKRFEEGDYEGSLKALDQLRQDYPDHLVVRAELPTESGTSTLVDHLASAVRSQQAWETEHRSLFENPPAGESAPGVTLETTAGAISLRLDQEKAPRHVENFLTLCREGFYNGTKFHRIVPGFMIQGGDPNSREGEPTSWGQGGPGFTIPMEVNGLYHFAGVLSAAKKPGDKESSGSQFFLTTNPAHHLDGQHVVFGSVVAGMDVVTTIAAGAIEAGTQDRPSTPVTVLSATVDG